MLKHLREQVHCYVRWLDTRLRLSIRLPEYVSDGIERSDVLQLGMVVLDSKILHPVTAERRKEDSRSQLPDEAICTHHFVSSWVAHDATKHALTEKRRLDGHKTAATDGFGQPLRTVNDW